MAINETIVTGRKFRKCIDAVNKTWQRISFWTKSSDVEFADGKNAETKLGAIDGITDSLVDTSSRMAASAKAVSTLNNNLGGCSLAQEGDDFYIVGADAVRKKLGSGGSGTLKVNFSFNAQMNNNDGQVGTGSGTLTVVMTNGSITSYNISGSGYAMTIGGAKNASGCSVFGFKITSITWNPN